MNKAIKTDAMVKLEALRESIKSKFTQLRMPMMVKQLQTQYDDPKFESMMFEERLNNLCQTEIESRQIRRFERLTKQANVPSLLKSARLNDIDYRSSRELDMPTLSKLMTCQWLFGERPKNLILYGACGTGKSYLAAAFANEALSQGKSVLFIRMERLLRQIKASRLSNCEEKEFAQLRKIHLLIIDDFLMASITDSDAIDLITIIEERAENRPIIITSQYPPSEWKARLNESVTLQGLADRLRNSHTLHLKGPSLRKAEDL